MRSLPAYTDFDRITDNATAGDVESNDYELPFFL